MKARKLDTILCFPHWCAVSWRFSRKVLPHSMRAKGPRGRPVQLPTCPGVSWQVYGPESPSPDTANSPSSVRHKTLQQIVFHCCGHLVAWSQYSCSGCAGGVSKSMLPPHLGHKSFRSSASKATQGSACPVGPFFSATLHVTRRTLLGPLC